MQTVMLAVVCCSCVLLTPQVDVPREKLQVMVVLSCITSLVPPACVCGAELLVYGLLRSKYIVQSNIDTRVG